VATALTFPSLAQVSGSTVAACKRLRISSVQEGLLSGKLMWTWIHLSPLHFTHLGKVQAFLLFLWLGKHFGRIFSENKFSCDLNLSANEFVYEN
jgi:hypothetical protein